MSNKFTACYEYLFRFLKQEVFDFEGYSFMTDYERVIRNTLANVFPECRFVACWFRYCQAIKQTIEKYPMLRSIIRINDKINRIYHKILSLVLLSPQYIKDAFMMITAEINSITERHLFVFTKFLKYCRRQCLVRVSALLFTNSNCIFM